jgi:NAD(P)-dependent dehydrogenase (short-subunit alcohol dehydrogenase family)
MERPLEGKVAVVTGAGRNIGREEALALARAGARVLVNDIGDTSETIAAIRAEGGEAVGNSDSASSWAGGKAIIDAAIAAFGRIDILVNNAGTIRPCPIEEMSEEDWNAVVDVNLKGYAATIRHAAPHFIAQKSGVIVNTGSTSALGHVTMANYAAAKEGALGLTRAVARDLGRHGVRCNLIRPINYMTGMDVPGIHRSNEISAEGNYPINGTRYFVHHPDRVMPVACHVAALTLLLCLPETAHISGQDFFIKGDEVGRYREPELLATEFNPGGWTTEALLQPWVMENLLGDIRNRYVRG